MNVRIKESIIETLKDTTAELVVKTKDNILTSTHIYGSNGVLDSLALVSFITDLEEKISEEFNKNIVLANERAMSQKTSPFKSVESLSEYIEQLLKE